MTTTTQLTLTRPDDWHLHVRDGAAMSVVTVAPNDELLEKLKSNMQEVRARGGVLYVLADADTHIESAEGLHVIRMPEHYGALSPILHVVPLRVVPRPCPG